MRPINAAAMTVLYAGEGTLRFDPQTHVALFSMEHHTRRNAIGWQLLEDMQQALKICHGHGGVDVTKVNVRCLVLESRVPGVFCAGADLKESAGMTLEETTAFVDSLRQTFNDFEDLPIPTIAAIEGKALGGGLELALTTDIRIAGTEAAMGFPETGLAIIPGAGGTVRAPALIGESLALELILSAEPIDAERALRMGLVNRCVPAGTTTEAALALAQRISRNGPLGVRAAKRSVREGRGLSRAAAMAKEQQCCRDVVDTQDRREGLTAFAEKRQPHYSGA